MLPPVTPPFNVLITSSGREVLKLGAALREFENTMKLANSDHYQTPDIRPEQEYDDIVKPAFIIRRILVVIIRDETRVS